MTIGFKTRFEKKDLDRDVRRISEMKKAIITDIERLCKNIRKCNSKILHFHMSSFSDYHPIEARELVAEHYSKMLDIIIRSSEALLPRLRSFLYEYPDSVGPLICTILHLSEEAKKCRDKGKPHEISLYLYKDASFGINILEARLVVLKDVWRLGSNTLTFKDL